MIQADILGLFVTACLAVNLTPGPSILYVTSMAVARGQRAGILAAFGLNFGVAIHLLAAALGISTLLTTSETAFNVVRSIGAAYLVFLGLSLLFAKHKTRNMQSRKPQQPDNQTLKQAMLVDLFNPKIALFFLAFLPQFVQTERGQAFIQTLMLGALFMLTGTIVNCIFAVLASSTISGIRSTQTDWIKNHNRKIELITRYVPGLILIALGLRLATLEISRVAT